MELHLKSLLISCRKNCDCNQNRREIWKQIRRKDHENARIPGIFPSESTRGGINKAVVSAHNIHKPLSSFSLAVERCISRLHPWDNFSVVDIRDTRLIRNFGVTFPVPCRAPVYDWIPSFLASRLFKIPWQRRKRRTRTRGIFLRPHLWHTGLTSRQRDLADASRSLFHMHTPAPECALVQCFNKTTENEVVKRPNTFLWAA